MADFQLNFGNPIEINLLFGYRSFEGHDLQEVAPMFKVAKTQLQSTTLTSAENFMQSTFTQRSQTATGQVVMRPGMTTMDPPPSIVHIDHNLLKELTRRFPEVPHNVVMNLIQQNGNNRETCMMAMVRASQSYLQQGATSSAVLNINPPKDPVSISNGTLRGRSDSTGSRGSISSLGQGQSPTSQAQYIPPASVTFYHSSSTPSIRHDQHYHDYSVNAGPVTAPPQTENFKPFPNTQPRKSVDFAEIPGKSYSPGQQTGQYRQQYTQDYILNQAGLSSPSSGLQYLPGYTPHTIGSVQPLPQGYNQQAGGHSAGWRSHYQPGSNIGLPGSPSYSSSPGSNTNNPSRPVQFDQSFPARSREGTFSPGSPHRNPPSQAGTPTHVPKQSPVTTPPRHIQSWDGYSPVTPPSGHTYTPPTTSPSTLSQFNATYRTPSPSGSTLSVARPDHSSSITFITQISKYIGPQGVCNENVTHRTPTSINIRVGVPGGGNSFQMGNLGVGLPQPNHNHSTTQANIRNWTTNIKPLVQNPPNPLTDTDQQMAHISQQPILPIMSPSSDPETSMHELHQAPSSEGRSSRSGSLASEDMAYTQSLLLHQRARFEKLKMDLVAAYDHRDHLQEEIHRFDEELLGRKRSRYGMKPSISVSDLHKLREENRALQVDSHLLTLEFDRITKGQAVIGQEDPNEDFYKRIPKGQTCSLPSSGSSPESTLSSNRSNLSPGVTHPSTHPPAPPGLVSTPSREPPREIQNISEEVEEENWSCSACTFANHPELTLCEMCNMPRVAHNMAAGRR